MTTEQQKAYDCGKAHSTEGIKYHPWGQKNLWLVVYYSYGYNAGIPFNSTAMEMKKKYKGRYDAMIEQYGYLAR